MSSRLSAALRWITHMLAELDVPYQVVGGLAARCYGASRPLVDIDLYVPDRALTDIEGAAGRHVLAPPTRHRDAHWDLTFMKLLRSGWQIEVAGADSAMVWDKRTVSWQPAAIEFEASERHDVEGIPLNVMPLAQLIDYKSGLARPVDNEDLDDLCSSTDI